MGSSLPLAVFLLALLRASHQTTWKEGAAAIRHERQEIEKTVWDALKSINPHPTLLQWVSEKLDGLEGAGKSDMRAISEFEGPGDKDLAIAESIKFWRGKMKFEVANLIKDPEHYKGVSYNSDRTIQPDPVNESPEYLKAEAKINSMAKEAIAEFDKRYKELMKDGPRDFSEVTKWSYRRFAVGEGVTGTKQDIRRFAQRAKVSADMGKAEEGITKFRDALKGSKSRFEDAVQAIFLFGIIPL